MTNQKLEQQEETNNQMQTNITQQELDALKATKSEQEWNDQCDAIKKARKGEYPPDWWAKVMMTGLIAQKQLEWN